MCQGGDVYICEDGEWVFHEDCDESIGDECWGGECVGACEVDDGAHQVDATGPVGLVVYGYQHHTSYGYSGGLDMEVINPIE